MKIHRIFHLLLGEVAEILEIVKIDVADQMMEVTEDVTVSTTVGVMETTPPEVEVVAQVAVQAVAQVAEMEVALEEEMVAEMEVVQAVAQAVAQVDALAAEANHASIETIAHLRVLAEVVAVAGITKEHPEIITIGDLRYRMIRITSETGFDILL